MTPSPSAPVSTRASAIELRPGEAGAVGASFALFFCMWAGYFAVRPVRETIGTLIGREHLADVWVITWIVSLALIPVYGWVVARLRRQVFLPCIYALVALVLVMVGLGLRAEQPDLQVGKFFYVFISVVNLLLISVFWSFMLELFDREQYTRLFGVIAAGGSAGAFCGPLLSDVTVGVIGNSGVLFLGAGLFVAAIVCQFVLLRLWSSGTTTAGEQQASDRPIGGNPFAGVTLILRSPYLLGISLFVVMISLVSTLLYFEQLRLVEIAYPVVSDRTRIFARLDWIVQGLTVFCQLFLTGYIAKRFGVVALLTLAPLVMVFGFVALAFSGTFMVLAVIFVLRRVLEYALVRPGREMLWGPLDTESKYKAKTTVDVPVYRGADALSAQVNNLVAGAGLGAGAVAWLGAGAAVAWAMVGWVLGRRYEVRTDASEAMGVTRG